MNEIYDIYLIVSWVSKNEIIINSKYIPLTSYSEPFI